MEKKFYGKGTNLHYEIPVDQAGFRGKAAFVITFVLFAAAFVLLWVGDDLKSEGMLLAGILLCCLFPVMLMYTIGAFLPPELQKEPGYRICLLIFDGLGLYSFAAVLIGYFVSDRKSYILGASLLLGTLIFSIIGICLLYGWNQENALRKRCREEVWAICENVEESRFRMTLDGKRSEAGAGPEVNETSLFTPTFKYIYNGIEYVKKMDMGAGNLNRNFEEGGQVKIGVNPNDPEEICWSPVPSCFNLIMGSCFLGSGVLMLILNICVQYAMH